MASVRGCLLVGSMPLPDPRTVFEQCLAGLPNRLKRVPDGETGARHYFTLWQAAVFACYPPMLARFEDNKVLAEDPFTPEQIDEGVAKLQASALDTGYDTAAIDSYAVFQQLRADGHVPAGVRFQVCIPTAANVISPFVQRAFQARAYPIYEAALFAAIRNIQARIPHRDLAIQYDLAVDTAFWEGQYLKPWFEESDVKATVVDYVARMADLVAPDVELGFHNCYGDMEHRHWFEPKSMRAVVDRGTALLERIAHPVAFFHAPVPVSATPFLDDYLEPLRDFYPKLKQQGGELYLGLIQHDDPEGTRRRIEAAGKVVPEFGVATECGMGRTPPEQVEGLLRLSTEVSEPVL